MNIIVNLWGLLLLGFSVLDLIWGGKGNSFIFFTLAILVWVNKDNIVRWNK